MKDSHAYTDHASYMDYDVRWLLNLNEQEVQVFCNGISRMYTIPEPVLDFKVEDEYVFIYVQDKYYQFKFEEGMFFVGDIFTNDGEHIDTYACHAFDED